jgi:hypothetical protein
MTSTAAGEPTLGRCSLPAGVGSAPLPAPPEDWATLLGQLRASVDLGMSLTLPAHSVGARLAVLDALVRFQQQMARLVLEVLGQVDAGRDTFTWAGLRTARWLASTIPMSAGQARALVDDAAALPAMPEVAAGLADGSITAEQATAIRRTLGDVAPETSVQARAAVERLLVDECDVLDPIGLRHLGDTVLGLLDPDAADEIEEAALKRDEARWARRRLTLSPRQDGMVRLSGLLTPEAAEYVHLALDPMAAPRPAVDGTPDPRLAEQRLHDALQDVLAEHLAYAGASSSSADIGSAAGEAPLRDHDAQHETDGAASAAPHATHAAQRRAPAPTTVIVTIPLEHLRDRTGPGVLTRTQAPLRAEHARRLACDARIIPAVLDGKGVPLDLGRARRVVDSNQRRALLLRDQGCAFPGCGRPPHWCDAHHIRHWSNGGRTDLDNLVLLCGQHHRLLHVSPTGPNAGWAVSVAADGLPEFTPPEWIDPDRRPRRNPRRGQIAPDVTSPDVTSPHLGSPTAGLGRDAQVPHGDPPVSATPAEPRRTPPPGRQDGSPPSTGPARAAPPPT